MDTSSSSLASIWEAAETRFGVVSNPYLAAGFQMGSSLLGLLVIIGAFWYNRRNISLFKRFCTMSLTWEENRLMGVQVVYSCLSTLLIMDALNLITTIIMGAARVSLSCFNPINCVLSYDIWFLSRWFGVMIHLVNASLCIYSLHQPRIAIRVHIIYLLVSVVVIIIVPLFVHTTKVAIFTLAAFMFLFALSVILTFIASTSSPSTATLKKLIMVVAMCNFLVVYVPTFILQCLKYTATGDYFVHYDKIYLNVLFFTNFHLIFDGLQCALFLKFPSKEEQQQQEQELQQQQKLGFQNAEFTGSTNVYQ